MAGKLQVGEEAPAIHFQATVPKKAHAAWVEQEPPAGSASQSQVHLATGLSLIS